VTAPNATCRSPVSPGGLSGVAATSERQRTSILRFPNPPCSIWYRRPLQPQQFLDSPLHFLHPGLYDAHTACCISCSTSTVPWVSSNSPFESGCLALSRSVKSARLSSMSTSITGGILLADTFHLHPVTSILDVSDLQSPRLRDAYTGTCRWLSDPVERRIVGPDHARITGCLCPLPSSTSTDSSGECGSRWLIARQ
jgi:hypothetical protein